MIERAMRTDAAGADAICSAISRTVVSRSSAGTTRDTIPWVSASSALRTRPVSTMSLTSPWPAIWNRVPDATGVRDHAVGQLGQAEASALGRDPDVAQQRALERAAHRPALVGDDDRRVDLPDLLDAAMARAA